ncbi:hypothetical protein AAG570_013365 [Ranatra chinensis]|uniref:Phosducin domain-containing protein n=1 Tax=Ranatra chinensis TaxID=642074 RepID=A0ABD0YBZ9_9HEMI
MTTLEDKILGEKAHCYCSSSSSGSEGEDSGAEEEDERWEEGVSTNTGPKGVISDWQRYKQLEAEKRRQEKIMLINKLTLGTATPQPAPAPPQDQTPVDDEKQRMEEMFEMASLPKFGKLFDLRNGNDFLDAVDNEHKSVTVIIHIYENNVPSCRSMNSGLSSLCRDYPHVKFCKLIGSSAGMSHRFKVDGVPALLIYKSGQLVGNFVRVTDELGHDFCEGDIESFLVEHGMIADRSCVPTIIGQSASSNFSNQDDRTAADQDTDESSAGE